MARKRQASQKALEALAAAPKRKPGRPRKNPLPSDLPAVPPGPKKDARKAAPKPKVGDAATVKPPMRAHRFFQTTRTRTRAASDAVKADKEEAAPPPPYVHEGPKVSFNNP